MFKQPLADLMRPRNLDQMVGQKKLLVGATTENPVMSIVPAIRSRCQIF